MAQNSSVLLKMKSRNLLSVLLKIDFTTSVIYYSIILSIFVFKFQTWCKRAILKSTDLKVFSSRQTHKRFEFWECKRIIYIWVFHLQWFWLANSYTKCFIYCSRTLTDSWRNEDGKEIQRKRKTGRNLGELSDEMPRNICWEEAISAPAIPEFLIIFFWAFPWR